MPRHARIGGVGDQEDQLGTLNLVTDEKRRQAAGLVRDGVSVSCAWTIKTDMPGEHTSRVLHYMVATGEAGADATWSGDFLGMAYHGNCITHVDALCHVFTGGKMYNGFPSTLVNSENGAEAESITLLSQGVVTRGVLLDIARLRGDDRIETPVAITPEYVGRGGGVGGCESGVGGHFDDSGRGTWLGTTTAS